MLAGEERSHMYPTGQKCGYSRLGLKSFLGEIGFKNSQFHPITASHHRIPSHHKKIFRVDSGSHRFGTVILIQGLASQVDQW